MLYTKLAGTPDERYEEISALLAIKKEVARKYCAEARQTEVEQQKAKAWDLWLNCQDAPDIAVEMGFVAADADADERNSKSNTVRTWINEKRKDTLFVDPPGKTDKQPWGNIQHFDIWQFAKADGDSSYFGKMPPQVVENLLWFYTEPGETVFDPMAGSGTTTQVAGRVQDQEAVRGLCVRGSDGTGDGSMTQTREFHDVANLFPLIEGQEFDDLVKDIRENGLKEDIWTYQGKIIDGRNRYRACMQAGVEPRCQEWDGKGSLVAFVVSLNVKRRHLTGSQLGAIAIDTEKELAKEAEKRTGGRPLKPIDNSTNTEKHTENFPYVSGEAREQAAQLLGTNPHYVTDAKKIAKQAPELIEHVKAGTLTIPDAKAVAQMPQDVLDSPIGSHWSPGGQPKRDPPEKFGHCKRDPSVVEMTMQWCSLSSHSTRCENTGVGGVGGSRLDYPFAGGGSRLYSPVVPNCIVLNIKNAVKRWFRSVADYCHHF